MPINSLYTDPDDQFFREFEEAGNAQQQDPQIEPEESQDELAPFEEFGKGVGAGIDQEQALFGAAKAGYGSVIGNREMFDAGMEYYREQMESAAQYSPRASWDDDFETIADGVNFAAFTLGNAIPSIATAIGMGGVGGIAAKKAGTTILKDRLERISKERMEEVIKDTADDIARETVQGAFRKQVLNKYAKIGGASAVGAGTTGTLHFGENFSRIYEETGLEDPGVAFTTAMMSGALDSVGLPFRALRAIFPDNPAMLSNLKEHIAEEVLTTEGKKRLANMLTEGATVAGLEGTIEATQEFITRNAVLWAADNLPESEKQQFVNYLVDDEAVSNYRHAFVAGAISGGPIGATIGGFKPVTKDDGTTTLDRAAESERLQKINEAKEAIAIVADTPLTDLPPVPGPVQAIDVETGKIVDVPESAIEGSEAAPTEEIDITGSDFRDTVETIEVIAGGARLEDIAEARGISNVADQQEILDVLEDRGLITQTIDDGAVVYSVSEQESVTAEEAPTPETPTEARAEPTISPTTAPVETVRTEPTVSPDAVTQTEAVDRQAPTISPLTNENRVIERPSVERSDRLGDNSFKVTYPQSGNEYFIKQYPRDAGGGFALFQDGEATDLASDLDGSVEMLQDIERQALFDPALETGTQQQASEPSQPRQRRSRENENQTVIEFPDSGNTYTIEERTEGETTAFYNVDNGNVIGANRNEAVNNLKNVERLTALTPDQDAQNIETIVPIESIVLENFDLNDGPSIPLSPIETAVRNDMDILRYVMKLNVSGTPSTVIPRVTARLDSFNSKAGTKGVMLDDSMEFDFKEFGSTSKLFRILNGNGEQSDGDSPAVQPDDRRRNPVRLPTLITAAQGPNIRRLEDSLRPEIQESDTAFFDNNDLIRQYSHSFIDMLELGFPVEFTNVSGVFSNPFKKNTLGTYYSARRAISINPTIIRDAVNPDGASRGGLLHVLAHEHLHHADYSNGYTTSIPEFMVDIVGDETQDRLSTTAIELNFGDGTQELYDAYINNTELGKEFGYPFVIISQRFKAIADKRAQGKVFTAENLISPMGSLERELFAQAGALFITKPNLLKTEAPKTYGILEKIFKQPNLTGEEIASGPSDISTGSDRGAGDRFVLPDVRSLPVTGGDEIPSPRGGQPIGERGGGVGDPSAGVGVEATGGDREQPGRLRPDVGDDITDQQRYLYQKSKGNVRGKFAVTKLLNETNAEQQLPQLEELVSRHPNVLDKPSSWLAFERDLTGTNETLRPPYALIELFNNMDQWAETHGRLSEEQIVAAREGLNTAKELGDLYESGDADPAITGKLMLWGMMSRMLTASAQEAGFVDLLTSMKGKNANRTEQFIDSALDGVFTDQDVADWRAFVPTAIKEGSFGRAGTSNANDFGTFLKKMSERDSDGVVKLQKLHDLIADRSIPSSEVRRQFQGMTSDPGIGNKVFSFLLLMTGRDDVVVLDRIQLNTMWDAGRYGKLIYDDIAMNFEGQHGLARYEVLENALKQKIGELYQRLGRGDEGSVGRYHWESWVLNSGQVVAHPTMRGLVADAEGKASPYAFLGAPEGRQNMYRYGAIYARDADGEQYIMYPDSKGTPYKFSPKQFSLFIEAIKKRGTGIIPKGFLVSDYNKGFPWYEADGIDRQKLDEQIEAYAEREATEVEYGVKEANEVEDVSDGSGQRVESTLQPDQGDEMLRGVEDPSQEPTPSFNKTDQILTVLDAETRVEKYIRDKRQKVVDRLEGLKRLENVIAERLSLDRLPSELSAYDAENLMHSKVQKQLEDFEKQHVEPIADLVKDSGLDIDQVGLYLLAKHAPERNKRMFEKEQELRAKQLAALERDLENTDVQDPEGSPAIRQKIEDLQNAPFKFEDNGSGITSAQAASVIQQAQDDGKTEQLETVAARIYKMLDEMRENMVAKGLLDEDTRADWEDTYQFYVPLKGFAAYEEGLEIKGNPKASGFSIRGSESFKARGRVSLPVNPLLVSFKDAEEKIVRAEKNQIAQRLLTMLTKNEDESLWQVWNNKNRPNDPLNPVEKMTLEQMKRERRLDDGSYKYIQVKRGGQTFFIEMKDRELNRQLQGSGVGMFNMNVDHMGALLNGLTKFQNFRRNMLINYNPSWGLVNPIRDIQTGLAFALSEQDVAGGRLKDKEIIGKITTGYYASLKAFYRYRRGREGKDEKAKEYDQFVKDYVEDGAPTGLSVTKSLEEQQRRFEAIVKQGDLKKNLKAAAKWVEDANQTTENAARLSAYVEARKAGVSRADAATLAKDLTVNFNRKGEYSSAIDAWYLFFNAAVQGNVNIAKALLRDGPEGEKVTRARLLAGAMVSFGFARTIINIMMAGVDDDDEPVYKDYNEFALKSGMLFAFEGQGYSIPLPYGYGIFDNIGRYGAEFAMGVRSAGEVSTNLTSSLDHHFNPLSLHASKDNEGLVDAALQKGIGLAPDIGEVALELGMNINFFGSDIVVPQNSFFTPQPASVATKRGTNELIKGATEFLNYATGSDSTPNAAKYRSGLIDINPEQAQHVFEFFLGGVGRFLDDTADTVAKMAADDAELKSTDLPVLRTFMPLPSEYSDRMEYYANRNAFRQYRDQYNDATAEERRKITDELGTELFAFNLDDKAAEKRLRELSKRKKALINDELIDPVKRFEQINKIDEQSESVYDQYNKAWDKVKP